MRLHLVDAGAFYLEVVPQGSKRWFWKYRLDTNEKRLVLGGYSKVALKKTRSARNDIQRAQQAGIDPVTTPPVRQAGAHRQ
ncbi:MAG: Arm DNA-binding domain-containing protein [Janthinobacterium lividum]